MQRNSWIAAAIAASMAVAASASAVAQPTTQTPAQAPVQAQERIYGSQLMTAEERSEYRQRMRELKTQQERDELRKAHHAKMQERAKERGVVLPDQPPARGAGAGPRYGAPPGMGQPGTGGGAGRP